MLDYSVYRFPASACYLLTQPNALNTIFNIKQQRAGDR